ncbi:helix-turn-helix domain-containing protein [Lactiplantibacillus dongliensis]|uniref:Helix-turn-helix domain-containing protein n=1 Tax=Lactiplantibacillus dongliensis TaxID=2559919 RepID=A0ABW1R283_9LACO|nr:helix-turn-helix domain-containing protein [Lactiplantibacillus dongliensis]
MSKEYGLNEFGLGFAKMQSEDNILSGQYAIWRKFSQEQVKGFFMLFSGFEDYLPFLSAGAIRLYLLYAIKSGNETGESWPSIQTMAEKLKTTERSINSWNSDLQDLGLIVRTHNKHKSSSTFLQPTSDYVWDVKQSSAKGASVEDLVAKVKKMAEFTNNSIVRILHLFQWRKGKDSKYSDPYNLLVIVLKPNLNYRKEDAEDVPVVYCFATIELSAGVGHLGNVADDFPSETPYFWFNSLENEDLFSESAVEPDGIAVGTIFDLTQLTARKINSNGKKVFDLIRHLNKISFEDFKEHVQEAKWISE